MGQLELFSLKGKVSRKLQACSLPLTLQIFKLHVSPPQIHESHWNSSRRHFAEKRRLGLHPFHQPMSAETFMTEKWDQVSAIHPCLPSMTIPVIHPFHDCHPMTAIHEEKGMGIQLPSVKVREVGPAWNPRLCQPSVRQVLKNHLGQFEKG